MDVPHDDSPNCRPRVLVVDGDPGRSSMRCGQLVGRNWSVIQAVDPREATDAVRKSIVDLVLLQLGTGDACLTQLLQALRQRSADTYLPIVVLADSATESDRCRCLEMGADEILNSQIHVDELVARMQALLRIKFLQDALSASRQDLQAALDRERQLMHQLQDDNAHLAEMATIDPLTHLHNVRYFQTFLADEFKIARRYGHPLSLLTLDLDHFKLVNDQYGHPAGDYLLKEFAAVIRKAVRESDVIARTGGEEFAVVLPRAGRLQADLFATRIRDAAAGHAYQYNGQRIKVTCSIGLASYPQDADVTGATEMIFFADQALLVAKQSGRNCVVHWFEMDGAHKGRLRAQLRGEPAPATRG